MRGIDWVAVPTSLVGQVDAAIGGKTAIDLPEAKNLVGAFHWPARTVIDPALLATLPEEERRNGHRRGRQDGPARRASALWELPDNELVRRCAAYKAALCLRDPHDRGPRHALNLGHTFAHALEAASGYGFRTARRSRSGSRPRSGSPAATPGRSTRRSRREPVRVDRERAWEALLRDKKGRLRIVLLGDDGAVEEELPEADVRARARRADRRVRSARCRSTC